jgi:hypothetical protein
MTVVIAKFNQILADLTARSGNQDAHASSPFCSAYYSACCSAEHLNNTAVKTIPVLGTKLP